MPRLGRRITAGSLTVALALAGCGGSGAKTSSSATATASAVATSSTASSTSSSASASSAASQTSTPPVRFEDSIPGLLPNSSGPELLPARDTCDGANISPALRWSNVPQGTKELVVFVAHEGSHGSRTDWAVAGLKPTLPGLAAGKLPPGAKLGRNSLGQLRYSVCPPKGEAVRYGVAVYALTTRIAVRPGFAGAVLLNRLGGNRNLALSVVAYKRA